MLIANPNYSLVDLYLKELNAYLMEDNLIDATYKSYDKEKNNFVYFNCFDISSDIKMKSIFFKELKYEGSLEFSFNKATGEVYIKKVPYIQYRNIKIPLFTSDIARIVVDKISKYISANDINVVFANPLLLIAIDKRVEDIIPSIKKNKNYNLLEKVQETIHHEEAQIIGQSKRLKEKADREDKSKEFAIAKKRVILGLDPEKYEDYSKFEEELTSILLDMWAKKFANIKRHLESTIKKYNELISKYSTYSEEELKQNLEEDIDYFIEKAEIERFKYEDYKSFIDLDERPFYTYMDNGGVIGNLYDRILEDKHEPLCNMTYKDYIRVYNYISYIIKLREKIIHYEYLINNPDKYVADFLKGSSYWGLIMQLPYWFRKGRDYEYNGDDFDLLMIRPGVANINFNNIRTFRCKRDFENYSGYSNNQKRITVMIPDSLNCFEIGKLLDYVNELGYDMHNIVCESVNQAVLIKKEWLHYKLPNTFINVDPDYYRDFWVETPHNKVLWHRYDFTSDYIYRRKYAMSLNDQYDIACDLVSKKANGDLTMVEDLMLGSYSSNPSDLQVEYSDIIANKEKKIAHYCKKDESLSKKLERKKA